MIKLESATATDPGRERNSNQDQVWGQVYQPSSGEPVGLFIVCDGVGGHHGGQYASQWAIESIKSEFGDFFYPNDPRKTLLLTQENLDSGEQEEEITRVSESRKLEKIVIRAAQKANRVVYEFAQENPQEAGDAGTTLTMAFLLGNRAIIANVGDSRTYLIREKQIHQITKDHSLVASLVASGQLKPEDVFSHPQRNLIYRSLGQKNEIQVDTFIELLKKGDRLLLCSDGLWEMIQDQQVIAHLVRKSKTPSWACKSLVDAANQAGGQDNISAVLVIVH
jgi:serine/threonine protein phosphatase PrpC